MDQADILAMCSSHRFYNRGVELYKQDKVRSITKEYDQEWDEYFIDAVVEGSSGVYNVWIQYDEEQDTILDYECTCPAHRTYSGMCKHAVAVCLKAMEKGYLDLSDHLHFDRRSETSLEISCLMDRMAWNKRLRKQEANGSIRIIPKVHEDRGYGYGEPVYYLTFRIGHEQLYVLKNITRFLTAVANEEMVEYGKKLAFVHSKNMFDQKAWVYVNFMGTVCSESYQDFKKELPLNRFFLEYFLMINLNSAVEYESNKTRQKKLYILDEDPDIKVKMEQRDEETYSLILPSLQLIVGARENFVKIDDTIYHCSNEYMEKMEEFLRICDPYNPMTYVVTKDDMHRFYNEVLIDLEEIRALDQGGLSFEEFQAQQLQVSYYLDQNQQHVMLKVMGTYGEETVNLLEADGAKHYRNLEQEQTALNIGKAYFPFVNKKEDILYFSVDDDARSYQLFDTGLRQLEKNGKLYASDRFRARRIVRNPKAKVGIALESGILSLKIDSAEFSREELQDIIKSYKKKQKYYRLKSGDFIRLEEDNALTAIGDLLEGLSLSGEELGQEEIKLPKYRAAYIDQTMKSGKGMLEVKRDREYKNLIRGMKNIEDSDYEVPEQLNGILRSYQKTGNRWMRTLADFGFGGILADDMGLGKTIQTISYLLGRKQAGNTKPSLIVCPASLVYNWQREMERFAPTLRVKMIAGNARMRKAVIEYGEEADVWITSYDTVKRDLQLYQKVEFDTQIIDEAQNIKNQNTKTAKTVKQIKSDIRFALTGTPIENRLSELWSIFDYLMPGILGQYEWFRSEYEMPIIQGQDQDRMDRLKKMVSSFILRRLKKDVLTELPEKVEQVIYAQMGEEQKKLYMAHAARLLDSLSHQSDEEIRHGKIEILAELTKLRQICCDPELLYEDYAGGSCKMDMCMELITEAIEGNHKTLIFSQFTSIFPILEERLKKMGIEYYKLTGATPKRERMQMSESFNQDQIKVFLISLKAGGTGLNLTGASIVIHLDPWWNVAAQNQATDRAHRIGQENKVNVLKLIAKDTIEEKIMKLQEQKQQLADEILAGESISVANLNREDLMLMLQS